MRYMVINAGVATDAIVVVDPAAFPQLTLVRSDSADIGDLYDGSSFSKPTVVVSDAQLQALIVARTQQRLDDFAKAVFVDAQGRVHGDYDGVNSASKYVALTDAQILAMPLSVQPLVTMFRADCQYLSAVTAQTWAVLWSVLAQVQAGNWPTTGAAQRPGGFADIEPSLPALAWPA